MTEVVRKRKKGGVEEEEEEELENIEEGAVNRYHNEQQGSVLQYGQLY